MNQSDRPPSWPLENSRLQREFSIYRVRRDSVRSPKDGETHDFDIVEAPDAVVVLAEDRQGDLVLVEQYRHGIRGVSVEFPGGILEDDDPLQAAARELREETGYEGADFEWLGSLDLNPSWETTRVHVVLARAVARSSAKEEDDSEDTRVHCVPREQVARLILEARMRSAVALAALHLLELRERGGQLRPIPAVGGAASE